MGGDYWGPDLGRRLALTFVLIGLLVAVGSSWLALARQNHADKELERNVAEVIRVQANLCDGRNDDRLALIRLAEELNASERILKAARSRFRPIDCVTGDPIPLPESTPTTSGP
jgi:hypothetical protein